MRFPVFSVSWLASMSAVYLALVYTTGVVSAEVLDAVGFIPARLLDEPWRIVAAPLAMIVTGDNVQFAYLVATFSLVVIAFEVRAGARQTATIFFVAGVGSVALVTALVFTPLTLVAWDNGVVQHAWTRPYVGASSGIFAVAGALAASLPQTRARIGLLFFVAAWEMFVWAWVFGFSELLSLFHYTSVAFGYLLSKRALLVPPSTPRPNP